MDVDGPAPKTLTPALLAELEPHTGPLPPTATPLSILSTHLLILPVPLARSLGSLLTPRQRTSIPAIKHRRHLHATSTPTPVELTATEGRRRWPLLWERLGGDPRVGFPGGEVETAAQAEAAQWAREGFMPGHEAFVGRLGALLAEEEEMGEWEEARRNRARERRLDEVGEEFDEESDEEDDVAEGGVGGGGPGLPGVGGVGVGGTGIEDQEKAAAAFERALLELYVDGLDTLDYDEVDFTPADDPIAARDAEDAWFDDEAPSATGASGAGGAGNGAHSGSKAMENGQGDYDY